MHSRTRIGLAVGAIIAVAFVLRPRSIDVTAVEVVRDSLSVTVPSEGRTRSRDRFVVSAPVAGRLTRLELDVGDSVSAGSPIGLLYPLPAGPELLAQLRAELDATEAQGDAARARVQEANLGRVQAERELERRRPLAESGVITKERFEQAQTAAEIAAHRFEAAEAALAASDAAVDAARARLIAADESGGGARPITMLSPSDGRVVDLTDPSARVVAPGEPLLTLGRTDAIELELDVRSEDAVRVREGAAVTVSHWGGDGTLAAHVKSVTRVGRTHLSTLGVEEQLVTVIATLDHPEPSLGIGYRISGDIVVAEATSAVVIPAGAWFRTDDGWSVFVLRNGRAYSRRVTLGHRNDRVAEVLDGLEEGDLVLTYPPDGLADGARVRPSSGPVSVIDVR